MKVIDFLKYLHPVSPIMRHFFVGSPLKHGLPLPYVPLRSGQADKFYLFDKYIVNSFMFTLREFIIFGGLYNWDFICV